MRQPKINRERAERARLAVVAQYPDGEDLECSIADILCDLRHLCDRMNLNFADLSDQGYGNYCAEFHPDDIEQSARAMHKRGDYPILRDGESVQ